MSHDIRICTSILNADFSKLDQEIASVAAYSDFVHLDVMDNIFVPNFTFDFEEASRIIRSSALPVDAHLMVANVDSIAPQYAEVGCKSVTIHAEASENISATLSNVRRLGARAGLALKPKTDISEYISFIDSVDMFLIMTVEPGFGGQKFMDEMLDKIRRTRIAIGSRPIWLQVDGGISLETIERAAQAGADTFVAGSAVFNSADPGHMLRSLRDLVIGESR